MYKVFRKYISERVLISVILSLTEFVFTPLMESADCNSVYYIALADMGKSTVREVRAQRGLPSLS